MENSTKVLRQIKLMEELGSPMQHSCQCGKTHVVRLSEFDLDSEPVTPKRLVRLDCAINYEYLSELLLANTELKVQVEGRNKISQICGNFLAKMYGKWMNR